MNERQSHAIVRARARSGTAAAVFQLSHAIAISTLLCVELLLRIVLGAAPSRAWQAQAHPLINQPSTASHTEERTIKAAGIVACVCVLSMVMYSRVLTRRHTIGQGRWKETRTDMYVLVNDVDLDRTFVRIPASHHGNVTCDV
jgi:hypothetical protein